MNLTITPNMQYKNNQTPIASSQANSNGGGGDCPLNGLKAFGGKVINLNVLRNNQQSSNLAPLARDTVSFGALRGDKILNPNAFISDTKGVLNVEMACSLERNAHTAIQYLENTLQRYLGKLISSNESDRPIQALQFRVKEGKEIFKKGVATSDKKDVTIECLDDLKGLVEDIIGGRIIIRDDSKAAVKKVLGALGKAVQDGKLHITQIENYRPIIDDVPEDIVRRYRKDLGIDLSPKQLKEMQKRGFFDYAAPSDMNEFKRICRTRCRELDFQEHDLPSGYQAIHLRVSLPNGYTGEIQLMGRDVERFKDIEDVYYKAKCGKLDADKYPETSKRLASLAPLKPQRGKEITEAERREWEFRQDAMQDYTYWSYIAQRLKGAKGFETKVSEKFLVAPDYLLNQGLGFNQMLPVIKEDRRLYKLKNNKS